MLICGFYFTLDVQVGVGLSFTRRMRRYDKACLGNNGSALRSEKRKKRNGKSIKRL